MLLKLFKKDWINNLCTGMQKEIRTLYGLWAEFLIYILASVDCTKHLETFFL